MCFLAQLVHGTQGAGQERAEREASDFKGKFLEPGFISGFPCVPLAGRRRYLEDCGSFLAPVAQPQSLPLNCFFPLVFPLSQLL